MLLYGVCWIRDLILNVLNPLWLILLRIMVLSQCNFRQDRARRHVRDPRRARPVRARRAARGYRWKGNVKVEGCNDIFMQSQYAVGAYARPRIRADAAIASNRRMARRHSPPPAPFLRNWPVGLPRHPGTNAGLRPTRIDTKS